MTDNCNKYPTLDSFLKAKKSSSGNSAETSDSAECVDDYNTDLPKVSFISPSNITDERNIELRKGWKLFLLDGIDDIVTKELALESTPYKAGSKLVSSRDVERTIRVGVRVCPCGGTCCGDNCNDYSIHDAKRELYEIADCSFCDNENCYVCCDDGECTNLLDYVVPDNRYCIMRIRACGIVRDVAVVRQGTVEISKKAKCWEFIFTYVAVKSRFYFPKMQSVEVNGLPDESMAPPVFICPPDHPIDITKINSFEHCLTIPYAGNVRGYPEIVVRGDVTNFEVTDVETGAKINLNRTDDNYTIGSCVPHRLNFRPGQREFTNGSGESIYSKLNRSCGSFFLRPNCPQGQTICLTGNFVDPEKFFFQIRWWNEYDSFFKAENEIPMTDFCGQNESEC